MEPDKTSARGPAALLVVDVQRDFCPGGALPAEGCTRIVPVINTYLDQAQLRSMLIYASRDWHPAKTAHFKAYGGEWPPHCVQGTPGAEFHPDLKLPPTTIIVSKGDDPARPGYSAFEGRTADGRSLLDDLRERHISTLYICGLTTDYCVKLTTLDALRGGLSVAVLTDAIAAIDVQPGDATRALDDMERSGALLTTGLPPARSRGPVSMRPLPPDVVLLAVEWQPRALIRAQLIEEGFEVVATDDWNTMRQHLQGRSKPRLVIVDLKGLPNPEQVVHELRVLMRPARVIVLTAMGTVSPTSIEGAGFDVLPRPIVIEKIVRAARAAMRSADADAERAIRS